MGVMRTVARKRRATAVTIALLLGGCATYRAEPLDHGATPPPTVILRDAAKIERPFLRPVTVDPGRPFDDAAIAAIAVAGNPDLAALRARAGIGDAQVFAAGLLPDPSFGFGIDTVVRGPDPAANIAGSLGFNLASLRTRGATLAAARAGARQVRLDLAWAEWQTAGQARIQAVRLLRLQTAIELQRATRDAADQTFNRIGRAAARGDLMPDQAIAARIASVDATDRLRVAERDLMAARFELTRLLGLPPGFELHLAAQTFTVVTIDPAALTRTAIATRTDLAALQAGYAAQEAAVRKAILDQFPSLDLTLNATRDSTPNTLLGPGIAFTLPLWNRNRGGIAVERATRAALRAEYAARLAQLSTQIAVAAATIALGYRQHNDKSRSLPPLETVAVATARAAARGDIAAATASGAAQAVRDKRLQIVQIEQDIAERLIALELLSGTLRESWN